MRVVSIYQMKRKVEDQTFKTEISNTVVIYVLIPILLDTSLPHTRFIFVSEVALGKVKEHSSAQKVLPKAS